jgi:ornithine cyclodeaminase/alanine dehydrogenase
MRAVFVPAAVTREVLDWDEMIAALRGAYGRPHAPHASTRTQARGDGGWLRCLVAVPEDGPYAGAKLFGVGRARRASYLIPLFDRDSAQLVALVDGLHVTALRTAATSALALDCLAPRRELALAVLGSGTEAQAHVRAFARVRRLRSVKLYSPAPERRARVAAELARELEVPCSAAAGPREALEGADLVLAAARSHDETPVFDGAWLRPGMLVVSIGSTMPEQREIDPQTIAASDLIVCDVVREVVEETGDFLAARRAGVVFEPKLHSLNELVLGRLEAQVAAARQPLYKSVGAAVQDVAVARIALERARERGLAAPLPVELEIRHL